MTQQFKPEWDDKKADEEWASHRKAQKPVSAQGLAQLQELRNECLNELPIKMNQLAERVRTSPDAAGSLESNELANELIAIGLRLKRMAEEAR